jgi:uncharacterized protein (TIGR02145 family)
MNMPIRFRITAIALSVAVGSISVASDQNMSGVIHSSRRMPDGNEWTTENLNVKTADSYCYDNAELNCRRYGRLYTWEAAQRACRSLKGGWRLPTDDEWRQMAKHFGGIREDSNDTGKAAYTALMMGGSSGLNVRFGGGREPDRDKYGRLEAHGFYWTASESSPRTAVFYNFGKGGLALNRQPQGEKTRSFSVRCIKETRPR